MRQKDKGAFFKAAENNFWILVRVTNEFSLAYIGEDHFAPKKIDCKAKTACNENHLLRGLVVDPYIHPDAYTGKLGEAKKYWDEMDFSKGTYTINENQGSIMYGCLMAENKYIYGDYDLYDIVDIKQLNRNLAECAKLHDKDHRVGANLWKVMRIINTIIGTPMIQHGGEAQFKAHSNQEVDVFGPKGEYKRLRNLGEIRRWYKTEFNGRKTLADSFGKPVRNNIKKGDPFKLIQGGKK